MTSRSIPDHRSGASGKRPSPTERKKERSSSCDGRVVKRAGAMRLPRRDSINGTVGAICILATALLASSALVILDHRDIEGRRPCLLLELDPRSLALGRIGLSVLLWMDLLERIRDVRKFYTDDGCCPRSASRQDPRRHDAACDFSVYESFGSTRAVVSALLLLGGVSSTALFLGFRTRLSTLIAWIHWRSLEVRCGVVQQAGDLLMRLLLWWCIFLPVGSAFSLDCLLAKKGGGSNDGYSPVHRFAALGLLIQLVYPYFMSALFKVDPSWVDGRALHIVLQNYAFSRSDSTIVPWLLARPGVARFMTRATWWGEFLVLPTLLGLGWWFPSTVRLSGVVFGILLHGGIATTMRLGLFPYICIVGWLLILPADVWDQPSIDLEANRAPSRAALAVNWIVDPLLHSLVGCSIFLAMRANLSKIPKLGTERLVKQKDAVAPEETERNLWWIGVFQDIYDLHNFVRKDWSGSILPLLLPNTQPSKFEVFLCRLLGQHQQWFMFDKPAKYERRFLTVGHSDDCREIDLFHLANDSDRFFLMRPSNYSPWYRVYGSHRWRKFFQRIAEPRFDMLRKHYAFFLLSQYHACTYKKGGGADHETAQLKEVAMYVVFRRLDISGGIPFTEANERGSSSFRNPLISPETKRRERLWRLAREEFTLSAKTT